MLGLVFALVPFVSVKAETLTCEVGQKVESVLITPAVPAVPAVTHTEVVVDTPAWDEVIIDTPAYTSCDYVGSPAGDYTNSSCTATGPWWLEVYKKVDHPAVTHTVHHEAITHEVVVIDVPEVAGTPAVYENQCVVDTSYVPPAPTPAPEPVKATPHPGGRRHCGTINTPSCEVWIAELNAKISGVPVDPQARLVELLKQVVGLLQKLQSMQ